MKLAWAMTPSPANGRLASRADVTKRLIVRKELDIKMLRNFVLVVASLLSSVCCVSADDLKLAAVFSDHMVLQR